MNAHRKTDRLEAFQAIIDAAHEATEKERQRCLDIVVEERRVWRSAGALTTLDMVALKIKEGVKA